MKPSKLVGSIVLIVILSIINYTSVEGITSTGEELIINAFNHSEAQFIQGNINFNGKISDRFMSIKEMEDIVEDISKEIGIDYQENSHNIQVTDSENSRQLTFMGVDNKNRALKIIIFTYNTPELDIEETNLFIDVVDNNKYEEIEGIKIKIDGIFEKFNEKAEITTCITGAFKGKLESSSKIKKMTEILQIVDGSKVEGMFDKSLISISAYSPNIDRFIFSGNKKMNLNIAMRYNEYEDQTYIWIGTPIITIGY